MQSAAGLHVSGTNEFKGVPTDPFYAVTAFLLDVTGDLIANSVPITQNGITYVFDSRYFSEATSSAGGQIYRGLVRSEPGLARRLKRLPRHVFERFYLQHLEGRSAQEEGNWERAISSFRECKALLEIEKVNVEEETYKWLLAWADLSLAHLYQFRADSRSNSDRCHMLEIASKMRREILDCVMPFVNSRPLLVRVCKSYWYTAQYEWGSLTSSGAKMEAVQEYAELLGCDKYEAEPQLCLLLYVDHYYARSFEASLHWIQEANRLWKKSNSQDWRGYSQYCLECEVELLIKLEMFREAVKVLEDLHYTEEYTQEHPKFAVKVYDWLQECYMQMSRRASDNEDAELAESYEQSAQLQHALKCSLRSDDNQENVPTAHFVSVASPRERFLGGWCSTPPPMGFAEEFDLPFTGIPASHPMMMPTPFPRGSWLGLVRPNESVSELYLKKLPAPIQFFMQYHCRVAQVAEEGGKWARALGEYQMAREFVKITEKLIDKETHGWLLAWVGVPLANLYHYRGRMFAEAVKIWEEILSCEVPEFPLDPSNWFRIFSDAVRFEQSYTSGESDVMEFKVADTRWHVHCFWLYFGYYRHGLLDASLRWLREAKRLDERLQEATRIDERHRQERKCSRKFDLGFRVSRFLPPRFFCCEYDYLRCEADLLMELKRFEEAESTLEKLLLTTHVRDGSPRLAREARQWLRICSIRAWKDRVSADDEEIADLESALELSEHTVDSHQQEGIADQSPSPKDFIFTADIEFPYLEENLVESEAGLEQHLYQLPVPFHLAFRTLGRIGVMELCYGGWESAICQFESCRELLMYSRRAINKSSHDWLLVWADYPLAQLYEFKKMRYKNALDIWREIFTLTKDDGTSTTIIDGLVAAAYQCVVHDYPDLRELVVRNSLQCRPDVFLSEIDLLVFLHTRNSRSRNLEVSLDCAQEGKRLLKDVSPGDENYKKAREFDLIVLEAGNLIELGRLEDAKTVLHEYGEGCDDAQNQILKTMREVCCCGNDDVPGAESRIETMKRLWRQTRAFFSSKEEQKGEEAVMGNDTYPQMEECTYPETNGTHRNDSWNRDTPIDEGFGFHGLFERGASKQAEFDKSMAMYCQSIPDSGAELKAPCQDENFLLAKQHFQKCIDLSVSLKDPDRICRMNRRIMRLYLRFEYAYISYLSHLQRQVNNMIPEASSGDLTVSVDEHLLEQAKRHLVNEIVVYINLTRQVSSVRYTRMALSVYASLMYSRQKYAENYVDQLEDHRYLYSKLQNYYHTRASIAECLFNLTESAEEMIQACRWRAFLYSEMERTRVMLYQLGPNSRSYARSRDLWRFEDDESTAVEAILESCATLPTDGTVFVQFSRIENGEDFYTYVINQKGELSITDSLRNTSRPTVKEKVKSLHQYLQCSKPGRRRRIGEDKMNKDLEYLYDVLMKPIAHHLESMKPEHKLILAPGEMLTKVPFAALRDKGRPDKQYLIERHTIAFTFSLRILEECSKRLQELRSISPPAGQDLIIALGNPDFGDYPLEPLKDSGKEADHIKFLFGSKAEVVTLLKKNATAEQLLYWAGKPSRQAIIHIGTHSEVNEEDHMKSVIRLARPSSSAGDDAPTNETTSSRGKQIVVEQEEDEDDDTDDGEMGISDEAETTIESRYMSSSKQCGKVVDDSSLNGEGSSSSDTLPKESRRVGCSSNQRSDSRYDLKAEDIIGPKGIQWRAELVVLSACRTSQGKLSVEGVLSLARAFMIAGVPCVVASQWAVLDGDACDVMSYFYDDLRVGKDVASALRSSMLKMFKVNCCKVSQWAAFAVWGVPTLCIPSYLQQRASE